MEPRELDDRIQISSLGDLKAALPEIARELKRAKIRHLGKAVRPAHLISGFLADYMLSVGQARFATARRVLGSLAEVQNTHPECEWVFCKKGDPAFESLPASTEHGIAVRSRKGGKRNPENVNSPTIKNGPPKR